jgi:transposase
MPQERREHTKEFRQEAIQMVLTQNLSYSEVGRRLDVKPSLIRRWCLVYGPSGEKCGPTEQTALEAENRKLREENARLRMEREILEKAAAFFAKDSR